LTHNELYVFNIRALKSEYIMQQTNMHINKICCIIYYYSPTCIDPFCDHHRGAKQE